MKMIGTEKGFTLLEIIAILVILGILAVVVVSRTTSMNAEVYTGADTLKSHLRYAQILAMNTNPPVSGGETFWGIRKEGGSYWLFRGTNPENADNIMRLPDDEKYINDNRTINLATKKINVDNFTVLFNSRGVPYSPSSATKLANTMTIQVTGGGVVVLVNITPETGYVP